jgi:amidase
MFEEALVAANSLDDDFNRTGELKGPLHGVPISLKDNFGVAGKAA